MIERYAWYDWETWPKDRMYAALKLRSDIFVVEQACIFPEIDGIDPLCMHLCATDEGGRLLGYLRLVPPDIHRPMHHVEAPEGESPLLPAGPSIGRVVVAQAARGSGLGRRLMEQAVAFCAARYPGQTQYVAAQQHLERFYRSLGFDVTLGAPYLEDGIWHLNLARPAP